MRRFGPVRWWAVAAAVVLLVPADPATAAPGSAFPVGASLAATPTALVPVAPARVLDTRALGPAVPAGGTVRIPVTGRAGVPLGARAVAVNLTATGTTAPGYLTAWPAGGARPLASNLNVSGAGQTVANLAVVGVGEGGAIDVFTQASLHVVADVVGYAQDAPDGAVAGRFRPVTPVRLLDTREGPAAPGDMGTATLVIGGRGGVPADAAAVAVTVTATGAERPGFVTVWPAGGSRPEASNLNLPGPGVVSNLVLVPLGVAGAVHLYTQHRTEVIVDVAGWFTGPTGAPGLEGRFVPAGPVRILDTRHQQAPLRPRFRRDVRFPAAQGSAVLANLTITESDAAGYLTAYPGRTRRPWTSVLNADGPGATKAGLALLPVTAGGRTSMWSQSGSHLVVDQAGWFTGAALPVDPTLADVMPGARGLDGFAGLDATIEAFLADEGVAGASVAVARDGRVVFVRSYGTADVTTGVPAEVDDRFRVASISKTLAAIAAVRLADRGVLALDAPVWPLLQGIVPLPADVDPRLRTVTLRQLLGHTAGLAGWPDPFFNEYSATRAVFGATGPRSCVEAARWFVTLPLAADPGTAREYVNVGYCLVGLVLEAATGRSYDTVITDEVLRPRTVVDMRVAATRGGHVPGDVVHATPGPTTPGGGFFMEALGAAGNWIGTAVDLVRVLDGLDPARAGGSPLVSPGALVAMTSRQPYDVRSLPRAYGLGLWLEDGGAAWGHTGALEQARGMVLHEADGTTWAILLNGRVTDHASKLKAVMRAAIATVPAWPSGDLSPDLP